MLLIQRKAQLLYFASHPANFIFSGILKTKDERDKDNPVKPFPDKQYIRETVDAIHESPIIFIPKSRQIIISWTVCAICLWWAMFKQHQSIFIQSKKEQDAAMFVFDQKWEKARISFMYYHLPQWIKDVVGADGSYSKLNFSTGSMIWGIPEGADIIRGHTASLLFGDEAAFQPEFEGSYTACLPMASKIIVASSANPSYFGDVVKTGRPV